MPTPISTNRVTLAGGSNITLSQQGNAVSIIGATPPTPSSDRYMVNTMPNAAAMALAQSTSYMFPITPRNTLSFNFMRFPVSLATQNSQTTVANVPGVARTASSAFTWNINIYSKGVGASSLSLQNLASTVGTMAIRWSLSWNSGVGGNSTNSNLWSVSYQMSYPMSTTGQATSSSSSQGTSASTPVSTGWLVNFTGQKVLDIPWATTLDDGDYWVGIGSSTASATQTAALSVLSNVQLNPFSIFPAVETNAVSLGEVGAATNASIQFPMGLGSYTAVAGATTASVPFANISVSSNTPIPVIAFHKTA